MRHDFTLMSFSTLEKAYQVFYLSKNRKELVLTRKFRSRLDRKANCRASVSRKRPFE